MKKENIAIILICIAIAGIILYVNQKSATQVDFTPNLTTSAGAALKIDWQDYAKGIGLAKAQNKNIFLYFHADWCRYCRRLTRTTFKNKAVVNYLTNNFISIRVNIEKNKRIAGQWEVRSLPALLFLKPDLSKINTIPGFIDAEQFLYVLKAAK